MEEAEDKCLKILLSIFFSSGVFFSGTSRRKFAMFDKLDSSSVASLLTENSVFKIVRMVARCRIPVGSQVPLDQDCSVSRI